MVQAIQVLRFHLLELEKVSNLHIFCIHKYTNFLHKTLFAGLSLFYSNKITILI